MQIHAFSAAFWFSLVCFAMLAPGSPAHAENYARVCATTIDADSSEAVLAEDSSPAPGTKVIVHLDAGTECTALVVPLARKGSRLANGWRPQIVLLPQWTEKTLPGPPSSWEWSKSGDPFELWIFFFKRDATGLEELQKLVLAMQKSTVNEKLLDQQTRKLIDKLSPRMSGHARLVQGPKAGATIIGGTMRRVDFPWRDYAQEVPLREALEGELVVRHGR